MFSIVLKQTLTLTSLILSFQDNVGLPSFSSTPIPEDSGRFQFNNSRNEQNLLVTSHSTVPHTTPVFRYIFFKPKFFTNLIVVCVTHFPFSEYDPVSRTANVGCRRAQQQAVFQHVDDQRRAVREMAEGRC